MIKGSLLTSPKLGLKLAIVVPYVVNVKFVHTDLNHQFKI